MATTGCRIGEVLALKWDAVDLEAGTAVIGENGQVDLHDWATPREARQSLSRFIRTYIERQLRFASPRLRHPWVRRLLH